MLKREGEDDARVDDGDELVGLSPFVMGDVKTFLMVVFVGILLLAQIQCRGRRSSSALHCVPGMFLHTYVATSTSSTWC